MSRQKGSGFARIRYKNPFPVTYGKCLKSKYEPHQGKQECERRVRQMKHAQ